MLFYPSKSLLTLSIGRLIFFHVTAFTGNEFLDDRGQRYCDGGDAHVHVCGMDAERHVPTPRDSCALYFQGMPCRDENQLRDFARHAEAKLLDYRSKLVHRMMRRL